MMALEGLTLGEAIWLTFTTITTTGYGDFSAKTGAGRASTIVLIYLSGIFLLTQAGSAFFELRGLRRERMRRGEWRWDLQDHIVFINAPESEPGDYLRRLLDQLQRSHAGFDRVPALVLTENFPDGLPANLEDDPQIAHVRGRFDDPTALHAAALYRAGIVVILAEREGDRLSDSRTFDVIHRIRDRGIKARIIAECVDDRNRDRLKRAGADAVVRPLRGYPEMIVRAIVAPGSERIIEQIFSSEGDECLRYPVAIDGATWAEVVTRVLASDYGTPIGYADGKGQLHTNPPPSAIVQASALFLLVSEDQTPTAEGLRAALAQAAAPG